jgi:hypothetical protein
MSSRKAPVPAAWIEGGWIYSSVAEQHGRFWIDDGRIWGPDGAEDDDTGYWIGNGWIWGPEGAANLDTGFFISGAWIYGPDFRLPFA